MVEEALVKAAIAAMGRAYAPYSKFPVGAAILDQDGACLLYTSPSPRDATLSRMPSSA